MIHGEFESIGEAADYTAAQLDAIRRQGVEVVAEGDEVEFVIPLNLAFGNPDLLKLIRLDAVLHGLGGEPQYKNDEQIDNQLRSVLFQIAGPREPDLPGRADAAGVLQGRGRPRRDRHRPRSRSRDAALQRPAPSLRAGREAVVHVDHRRVDGSASRGTSTSTTRESSSSLRSSMPTGTRSSSASEAADGEAVVGVRRTTLAARLKALYGDTDKLDAFVGMVSERHVPGTEFGELQLAIWKQQFQALRDGDRFFYLNDPELREIERQYGITYRRTLGQIIEQNAGIDVQDNVFIAVG